MADTLRLTVAYRQVAKRGLTAEQCEDAWAANPSAGRFAVADGATDSYASGRFARLLVYGFVDEAGPRSSVEIEGWSTSCAEAWAEATPIAGLPWYKQEKARLGAHCTFLGVQLEGQAARDHGTTSSPTNLDHETAPSLVYRAFAVGDVCLFHVRQDRLLEVMPIARPEDFGVQPALVATSRSYPGPGLDALVEWTGELAEGDSLYLASDAVARWMLVSADAGEFPWHAIADAGADEFAALVEHLRDEGHMRNDDVTVVAVSVEPPPEQPEEGQEPPGGDETPRRHSPGARRQIERAAAVSLAVGALGVGLALVWGPKAAQGIAESVRGAPFGGAPFGGAPFGGDPFRNDPFGNGP